MGRLPQAGSAPPPIIKFFLGTLLKIFVDDLGEENSCVQQLLLHSDKGLRKRVASVSTNKRENIGDRVLPDECGAIIATAIPAAMRPYSRRHREAFGET